MLEDIVDHGNVGGIFRCAAALGVAAVILSPRCADPLYRRSVKVSMGAVFAVPYARMADWQGGLADLRRGRLPAAGADPGPVRRADEPCRAGRTGRAAARHRGRRAVLALAAARPTEAVCIPMAPAAMAAGVDSLNVVAAAAIACHAFACDPAAG